MTHSVANKSLNSWYFIWVKIAQILYKETQYASTVYYDEPYNTAAEEDDMMKSKMKTYADKPHNAKPYVISIKETEYGLNSAHQQLNCPVTWSRPVTFGAAN